MTRTQNPAPYGAPGLVFGAYGPGTGYTKDKPHAGQDFEWLYANPSKSKETYAPVGGRVVAAYNDGGYHNGYGNYVAIRVTTTDGTVVESWLCHHETGSVRVKVGDVVTAGQRIGTMGATGRANGIHLHEALWIGGFATDPIYWRTHDLPGTPAGSGGGGTPFPPNTPNRGEDDAVMYLKATSGTDMVRANNVYADNGPAGSWRGVTNLEYVFINAQIAAGVAICSDINGVDLGALFALKGVAEQPEVTPIPWGDKGDKTLIGLGAPTGRIKFPGTTGFRGSWHYPPVSNR